MKFTKSNDGKYRANIAIKFRIDASMLEAAAATVTLNKWLDADGKIYMHEAANSLTKTEIEKQLRKDLWLHGIGYPDMDDNSEEEALEASEDFVRYYYPEAYLGD